ncbi:MAG TPA: FAD binding domain-containing protein [Syntrophorhabdales bacterium]|nr:FAD binding domain-containing protein [Syntrophorhabdales bacterium]
MKNFAHVNARSVDEAVAVLQRYGKRAAVIAGGTDLLGKMKDEILPSYPEALVNIKTIAGLDFIEEEGGALRIGALTRLEDIATDRRVRDLFPALAEAARRTASTHLREMGTIGGNICQDIRCWYYRNQNNRFPCLRKGGGKCYAIDGDNRYHSIFGGSVEGGCYAVHPSDTAPALIALDASLQTSHRVIKAEDFFQVDVTRTTVLHDDEIVTEVVIPRPFGKSAFIKFALRKAIDFPIVNCAAMAAVSEKKVTAARICLNAVYVIPIRARAAEEAITGKEISDTSAEAAGAAAVSGAKPMPYNGYMVQIAKTMVKRAILGCI